MFNAKMFSHKSLIVFSIVIFAYIYLYNYRYNEPLDIGSIGPDFTLKTFDNKTFYLYDINSYKAIIFFKHNTFFSKHYLQFIEELKEIYKNSDLYIILLFYAQQDRDNILSILHNNKQLAKINDITYLADIKKTAKLYGVKSWPHFYLLDKNNRVVYRAKTPSINKINIYLGA